jgi:DnaJ family protein C protein 3
MIGAGLALMLVVAGVWGSSPVESDEAKALLLAGDKAVRNGRNSYQEAVSFYTKALNINPASIRGLYSRAELLSMMKEPARCKEDLNALLALDGKHRQGLALRSKLLAQTGQLLDAARDQAVLVTVYREQKNQKKLDEAVRVQHSLQVLGQQWADTQDALARAESASEKKQTNHRCMQVLQGVISEYAKDNVALRLLRAECALNARERVTATEELKYVIKKEPQNLAAVVLGARAFRELGALDQARSEIKRCLSLDPEFQPCQKLHKLIRQYAKVTEKLEGLVQAKSWEHVLIEIDEAFELEDEPPNIDQLWRWRCEALVALRETEKGLEACTTLLELENGDSNPTVYDIFLLRADLHVMNDDLDKAEADVRKAAELQNNNDRVREYQGKMQKLREAASRKDYYKILNLKKTASNAQIRKAFRTMAKKYHPDQLRSKEMTEKERQKMDQLFRDVNEAKEVLMDEEKRRRYDNGEDVTKPQQQQGHHGSPFHFNFGGGQHFQQGGFHFNFG